MITVLAVKMSKAILEDVQTHVKAHPELGIRCGRFSTLQVIAQRADTHGKNCTLSLQAIADMVQLTYETVSGHVQYLCKIGVLSWEWVEGQTRAGLRKIRSYSIHVPKVSLWHEVKEKTYSFVQSKFSRQDLNRKKEKERPKIATCVPKAEREYPTAEENQSTLQRIGKRLGQEAERFLTRMSMLAYPQRE